jgi:hypothetical protein
MYLQRIDSPDFAALALPSLRKRKEGLPIEFFFPPLSAAGEEREGRAKQDRVSHMAAILFDNGHHPLLISSFFKQFFTFSSYSL